MFSSTQKLYICVKWKVLLQVNWSFLCAHADCSCVHHYIIVKIAMHVFYGGEKNFQNVQEITLVNMHLEKDPVVPQGREGRSLHDKKMLHNYLSFSIKRHKQQWKAQAKRKNNHRKGGWVAGNAGRLDLFCFSFRSMKGEIIQKICT